MRPDHPPIAGDRTVLPARKARNLNTLADGRAKPSQPSANFEGSLTTLGYSASRQTTIDVTNLIVPQASIRSLNMFAQPKAAVTEAWNVIASLLKSGAVKPIVAKNFRLAEAAEALRYLIEGRPFGRVVLTI